MKIVCVCCGKQAVKENVPRDDRYRTKLDGGRTAFRYNECFCGYCSEDMDENGLFPEEYSNLVIEE